MPGGKSLPRVLEERDGSKWKLTAPCPKCGFKATTTAGDKGRGKLTAKRLRREHMDKEHPGHQF